MPRLDWIGKKAVLNHHKKVPFHLLKCDPSLSVGDPKSGNLLVQGDNLLALKALLPYYTGQVKCIYIDPPYNTGNEKWVYNDNVNSPEIRAWLGSVVGEEAEDLSRHDKWLCMMYPRIKLLKEFLTEDGGLFISIDDSEVSRLRLLLDDIFGTNNFLATIIWQKRTSPDARLPLGPAHDYIVVYGKNVQLFKKTLNKVPVSEQRKGAFKNPDNDPRGEWASVDLTGQMGHATLDQFYEILTPAGKKIKPPPGRCWALAEKTFLDLVKDNRIWFGKNGNNRPRLKKFLKETEGVRAWTWWPYTEVGHNQEATKNLNEIMHEANIFDNPKPTRLIQRILQLATDKDSIVMDSFAGSGTTGQAVLTLNNADDGNRKFIMIEMDKNICSRVTARRIENVIHGYIKKNQNSETKNIPGLGGGFKYCTLGESLFDGKGQINETVSFVDLAKFVFFKEAGIPLTQEVSVMSPLIGTYNGIAVYLLYNGVLRDKTTQSGNVLTRAVLAELAPHNGPKVVYGTSCRIGLARLKTENIIFRQIPYELKVN